MPSFAKWQEWSLMEAHPMWTFVFTSAHAAIVMNSRRAIDVLRGFPTLQKPCVCRRCAIIAQYRHQITSRASLYSRAPHAESQIDESVPFRKALKEEAKAEKRRKRANVDDLIPSAQSSRLRHERLKRWRLTVGIEVHAELNTERKLFSQSYTSSSNSPNHNVAPFDIALPGAQPGFQEEILVPAVRAALALGCKIQRRSSWDRKHYFWWDQPNGYQITQYYHPFAKDGEITLWPHDDIDPADHPSTTVHIKQIQMEQDTAKTLLQPPSTHLLDFNRAGHPLIEIITEPHIHTPKTAAALVRKIQAVIQTVGANSTGMELGGLRADVNVSVKRKQDGQNIESAEGETDWSDLGQRTEIKNLSSFKAVEDAIAAERDRQIEVLEGGGVIEGETRGWTLGSTETKRLRGKEGEVDYRYMPDPDLSPVLIGEDLVQALRNDLPALADDASVELTQSGLSMTDAKTLVNLDNGDRLEYFWDVVHHCRSWFDLPNPEKVVANWQVVLHDIPTHLSQNDDPFPYNPVDSFNPPLPPTATSQASSPPPTDTPLLSTTTLAALISQNVRNRITLPTARKLMALCHAVNVTSPHLPHPAGNGADCQKAMDQIAALVDRLGVRLLPMTEEEYDGLVVRLVAENGDMARKAREEFEKKGKDGKIKWFVGQMMRSGDAGRVQPARAEEAVRRGLISGSSDPGGSG